MRCAGISLDRQETALSAPSSTVEPPPHQRGVAGSNPAERTKKSAREKFHEDREPLLSKLVRDQKKFYQHKTHARALKSARARARKGKEDATDHSKK